MAYSKQTWDTSSYVNPTRMNHIEDGIESASTATGTEYSSGVSVKNKIDNDFFGGNSIHAETRKSTISEAIEEVCAGNADHFFSLENYGTITDLTGMGNRQFAFGWLNNTKTYGWAIVCSFGGARYGKRNGSTTFSWNSFSG